MGDRNKRVFSLLKEQCKTKAAMSRALNVSKSAISQWEKNGTDPSYEQCEVLADFFNTSVSYLWNGKEQWDSTLTDKDDKDIQKQLQRTLNQLENGTGLMFDGDYMDEQAIEKLKNSLELVMRGTRKEAKEKFTPKKYKK